MKICARSMPSYNRQFYGGIYVSKEQWLSVAKEFEEKWEFPNCVGAIDGKHIPLINPFNSGSTL